MFEDDIILAEYLEITRPTKISQPHPSLVSNDYVGVEVEIESASHLHNTRPSPWRMHEDGSLRNGGVEFTFGSPLQGSGIIGALDHLDMIIKRGYEESEIWPNKAHRGSVHVHVDCTDMQPRQLLNMLVFYSIFETALFKGFANDRMTNTFCIPFNECLDMLHIPRSLHSGWDSFSGVANHPNIGRYCAFNLKSLFKFGTIEFRHHPSEWEKEPLLRWINACLSFKRAAMVHGVNFKEQFFLASLGGFEGHLRDIFPRDVAEQILGYYTKTYSDPVYEFNRDVIQGIRFIQHAVAPKTLRA